MSLCTVMSATVD